MPPVGGVRPGRRRTLGLLIAVFAGSYGGSLPAGVKMAQRLAPAQPIGFEFVVSFGIGAKDTSPRDVLTPSPAALAKGPPSLETVLEAAVACARMTPWRSLLGLGDAAIATSDRSANKSKLACILSRLLTDRFMQTMEQAKNLLLGVVSCLSKHAATMR